MLVAHTGLEVLAAQLTCPPSPGPELPRGGASGGLHGPPPRERQGLSAGRRLSASRTASVTSSLLPPCEVRAGGTRPVAGVQDGIGGTHSTFVWLVPMHVPCALRGKVSPTSLSFPSCTCPMSLFPWLLPACRYTSQEQDCDTVLSPHFHWPQAGLVAWESRQRAKLVAEGGPPPSAPASFVPRSLGTEFPDSLPVRLISVSVQHVSRTPHRGHLLRDLGGRSTATGGGWLLAPWSDLEQVREPAGRSPGLPHPRSAGNPQTRNSPRRGAVTPIPEAALPSPRCV